MDAFEKWRAEYGIEHPMYDRPNYRERFYASEAFRAGMRRAAQIARDCEFARGPADAIVRAASEPPAA